MSKQQVSSSLISFLRLQKVVTHTLISNLDWHIMTLLFFSNKIIIMCLSEIASMIIINNYCSNYIMIIISVGLLHIKIK